MTRFLTAALRAAARLWREITADESDTFPTFINRSRFLHGGRA